MQAYTAGMPGRNLEKIYAPQTFYHVYNRGVNRRRIFEDAQDYRVFLNLFKRHLSLKPTSDKAGRVYPHYREDLELISYCLMPNHFHALVYVGDNPEVLTKLFRSIATAYVVYFNRRYGRLGPLFQDRFRAVIINTDEQLWHISRYIHLNPVEFTGDYKSYPYSSFANFTGVKSPEWLNPKKLITMFKDNRQDYSQFVAEYESRFKELKESEELY